MSVRAVVRSSVSLNVGRRQLGGIVGYLGRMPRSDSLENVLSWVGSFRLWELFVVEGIRLCGQFSSFYRLHTIGRDILATPFTPTVYIFIRWFLLEMLFYVY